LKEAHKATKESKLVFKYMNILTNKDNSIPIPKVEKMTTEHYDFNCNDVDSRNVNDSIADIKTISECLNKMKELAKEKISDSNINVRHMADLMFRYVDRIEKLIV